MLRRRRRALRRACNLSSPLHITEHGAADSAEPVVLIHGTMDRSVSFAPAARRLPDLRVITYDRRGYGRSAHVTPRDDMAAHVDDLAEILDGRQALLVGHSFGGDVALAFALAHPGQALGVGAFEPPMPWLPWWPAGSASQNIRSHGIEDPGDVAERFIRLVVGDAIWEKLPQRTKDQRRAEGPAVMADIAALTTAGPPFSLDALITLAVPLFLASGDRSKAHQREGTVRLGQELGAPVTTIPGARHGGHSSHPEEFSAWVRNMVP